MSLVEAISLVADGDKLVMGGVLTAREPNALVRQLIKSKKKNLHSIDGAHSFAVDLLCAGDVLGACENSFAGYEFDLGLALNYRRACEKGTVKIRETDCNILLQQWRATEYGIPFMPMPRLGGSDLLSVHPEFIQMQCPYTGDPVTLVPALKPDVAIIHAQFADVRGNVKIMGPIFKDKLKATIAETVIVSVEEVVSEAKMKELQPTIPYYLTTAIVKVPFGSHPTCCYPNYAYDRKHLKEFVALSKTEETMKEYLGKYIYGVETSDDYLTLIGGEQKTSFLQSWKQGKDQWMEVFK